MLFRFFILAFIPIMTVSILSQTMPPPEPGVSRELAQWRAANYSDVRYQLNITLKKGSSFMKGNILIRVNLTEEGAKNDLILDWRAESMSNDDGFTYATVMRLNEWAPAESIQALTNIVDEHFVLSKRYLRVGENIIKINFASPIKTSGSAITRYIDKEDGAEYIYSLFVPSDASTAFPVFDQPDLKARFTFGVNVPKEWEVATNSPVSSTENFRFSKDLKFSETKPISTYVFAFAAGDFEVLEDKQSPIPSKLYVRKSQLGKLIEANTGSADGSSASSTDVRDETPSSKDPKVKQTTSLRSVGGRAVRAPAERAVRTHGEEVFRLNRESIKFLEDYFDYKFPFPKYDLVLIPEFPFGGMEHAGATFLRESSIIFPTEPTANNYISRASLIFHENAHQWFGDTVTMKWFDDLWLKEGFATFMAYKTLEKVLPEYNAWKIFYERTKPLAYATDVTKGTTPIWQELPNLSAAKSAYGNIVYQKAPGFLRQAEFFWGEENFRQAVRNFLKNHEFANAEWIDLVKEIANVEVEELKKSERFQNQTDHNKKILLDFEKWRVEKEWAEFWVKKPGMAIYRITPEIFSDTHPDFRMTFAPHGGRTVMNELFSQEATFEDANYNWVQNVKILKVFDTGERQAENREIGYRKYVLLIDRNVKKSEKEEKNSNKNQSVSENELLDRGDLIVEQMAKRNILYVFPNYQDYGYGIFLLDEKSKKYILKNIQNEKDDFLRSMMWGSLWDSVRFAELDPEDYVELAIKNISVEKDVTTISAILGRVDTAFTYYLSDRQQKEIAPRLEDLLVEKMKTSATQGERITFYRAFLGIASSEKAKGILKDILSGKFRIPDFSLKTKDKFDIVTKLIIMGDKDAPQLLAELEKTETDDAAKRYAYAAKAGLATKENKAKFWNDFVGNKDLSESWIEEAVGVWNAPSHSDLTLPYLEKALAELPNLKRSRKIFFVNGWLASFIGGQKSPEALAVVNKFLKDNPELDIDLRRKILERVDGLERAVKIREKYGK